VTENSEVWDALNIVIQRQTREATSLTEHVMAIWVKTNTQKQREKKKSERWNTWESNVCS